MGVGGGLAGGKGEPKPTHKTDTESMKYAGQRLTY